MKAVIATIASLFIPGIGHLVYGKVFWGLGWFLLAWTTCGMANLCAAGHIIYIASK
jgi:TM2 domain-containing membrane protein YozV